MNIQTEKQAQITATSAMGIFMLYLCISGNGVTGAAIRTLAKTFPDVSYTVITMMNTIPSIGVIIGSLFMGWFMGNKASFKTSATIAFLSYSIIGMLPAIVHPNYVTILVIRVFWGIAAGFIAPIGSAVVLRLYRDYHTRSKVLGWGYAFKCGGSVLFSTLGGILCSIGWQYTFLGYGIVFIAWILFMLTFKEPPTVEEICKAEGMTDKSEFEKAKKVKLRPLCWIMLVFWCVYSVFQIPFFMNISVILDAHLHSGAAIAGFLSSFIMVGGVISNALQSVLLKGMRRWTGLIATCVACIGCVLAATTGSLFIFIIATILYGFGGQLMLPLVTLEIGSVTSSGGLAFASSLIFVAMNVGNFFSAYSNKLYINIGGDWLGTYVANGIALVIFGVIWTILTFITPTWKKSSPNSAQPSKTEARG